MGKRIKTDDKLDIGFGPEVTAKEYLQDCLIFYGDSEMTAERYQNAFLKLVQILLERGVITTGDIKELKP